MTPLINLILFIDPSLGLCSLTLPFLDTKNFPPRGGSRLTEWIWRWPMLQGDGVSNWPILQSASDPLSLVQHNRDFPLIGVFVA